MRGLAQTLDVLMTLRFRDRADTDADTVVPIVDFSSFIFSADRTLR